MDNTGLSSLAEPIWVSPVHLSFDDKIEAISAADVVIVPGQSSMIPEAMILQKPVVKVTLAKDHETLYTEADGIIIVEETARLGEALAELINDPAAREAVVQRQNAALPELNFGNDGRATERLADLILDLAVRRAASLAATPPRKSSTPASRSSAGSPRVVHSPERLLAMTTKALEMQNFPAAEGYLRDLNQHFPDLLEPLLTLSDVLTLQEKHQEAAEVLRAARQINPAALTLLKKLGLNCRQRGDLSGAMSAFSQAWNQNPADLEILSQLGLTCLDLGLPQEAKGYFAEAARGDPGDIELWLRLAQVARQVEDQDSFNQACDRAAALNPAHPRLQELAPGLIPQIHADASRAEVHDDLRSSPVRSLSSIIIPVFNNLALTRQCLESIWTYTDWPHEIIVVDNGSSDGTHEYLGRMAAAGRLQVITNPANLGFAKASNQGARAAKGEFLVFLNNDTIVKRCWLEELMACAQRDDKIGAVGAKLLYPDDTIQHAGVVFTKAKLVYHIYNHFDQSHPAVNKEREFQAVTAACMLVRKDIFFAADAFDETYRNGLEDVDLCFKLREQGYKIVYNPRAAIYHLESKTPGRFDREHENFRVFKAKWLDKIIGDDEKYYQEDGIKIEVIDKKDNVNTILAHDRNDNYFWREAREYRQQGILDRAETSYFRALRFNPFDPRTGLIAQELADLFETQGKHAQTEPLHRLAAFMLPRLSLPEGAVEVRESI